MAVALLCISMAFASSAYGHNKVVVIPMAGDDAPSPTVYAIGDTGPAGGKVFYITDGGIHGLEAAPTDSATSIWGCSSTDILGGESVIAGAGAINTAEIIGGCVSEEVTAAEIADAFTLNGFSDWFLPSQDELNLLFLQKSLVGNFANNFYWSSSEFDTWTAWFQIFANGDRDDVIDGWQTAGPKSNTFISVRPVRAF